MSFQVPQTFTINYGTNTKHLMVDSCERNPPRSDNVALDCSFRPGQPWRAAVDYVHIWSRRHPTGELTTDRERETELKDYGTHIAALIGRRRS